MGGVGVGAAANAAPALPGADETAAAAGPAPGHRGPTPGQHGPTPAAQAPVSAGAAAPAAPGFHGLRPQVAPDAALHGPESDIGPTCGGHPAPSPR